MKIILPLLIAVSSCLLYSCNKDYSAEGSLIKKSNGTWSFNENLKLYNGNIDTAYITLNNGTLVLHLQGPSKTSSQVFSLELYTKSFFKPGNFTVSANEVNFMLSSSSRSIYNTDLLAGNFSVNIADISNNNIKGSFSGAVLDSGGLTKNITVGQFSSTIDLKNNTANTSSGNLGTAAGQCSPAIVSGTYAQNIVLTTANTVQIQVNVTTPGTFLISTNVVNGMSFSKSGIFNATGIQNIILNGNGTPTSSGTKTFTLSYGTNTCNFDVIFN